MHFFGPGAPLGNEFTVSYQLATQAEDTPALPNGIGIGGESASQSLNGLISKTQKVANGASPSVVPDEYAMDIDEPERIGSNGYPATETTSHHDDDAATDVEEDMMLTDVEHQRNGDSVAMSPDQMHPGDDAQSEELPLPTLVTGKSAETQISPREAIDLRSIAKVINLPNATSSVQSIDWNPITHEAAIAEDRHVRILERSSSGLSLKKDLVELEEGSDDLVTAVVWHPDGTLLAVATYEASLSNITIFDAAGRLLGTLTTPPDIIIQLRWAQATSSPPLPSLLCGMGSNDTNHGGLYFWDSNALFGTKPKQISLGGLALDNIFEYSDEIWTAGEFGVTRSTGLMDASPEVKYYKSSVSTSWHFIRSVRARSDKVVVAASADDMSSIWCVSHNFEAKNVHQSRITAIDLCAPPSSSLPALLATASEDSVIKLWNVDINQGKKFILTRILADNPLDTIPILSLKFHPLGIFLASASADKLTIWQPYPNGPTRYGFWTSTATATSTVTNGSSTNGTKLQGNHERSDMSPATLAWEHDGDALIYGMNRQVMIPSLRAPNHPCSAGIEFFEGLTRFIALVGLTIGSLIGQHFFGACDVIVDPDTFPRKATQEDALLALEQMDARQPGYWKLRRSTARFPTPHKHSLCFIAR